MESTIGIIFSLSLLASSQITAIASICDIYPPQGMKPFFTYKGTYTNSAWGFAVEIPEGYVGGLYQDPTAPQHGIQVILKWKPRSTIQFSAYSNSLEDETGKALDAIGCSIFRLTTVRKQAQNIESFELHKSKLGTHPALTYVIHYTCPDSSQIRVEETCLAIPPERNIVYRITLETTQEEYDHNHVVLQRFISSWRLIERK